MCVNVSLFCPSTAVIARSHAYVGALTKETKKKLGAQGSVGAGPPHDARRGGCFDLSRVHRRACCRGQWVSWFLRVSVCSLFFSRVFVLVVLATPRRVRVCVRLEKDRQT